MIVMLLEKRWRPEQHLVTSDPLERWCECPHHHLSSSQSIIIILSWPSDHALLSSCLSVVYPIIIIHLEEHYQSPKANMCVSWYPSLRKLCRHLSGSVLYGLENVWINSNNFNDIQKPFAAKNNCRRFYHLDHHVSCS